MSVRFEIGKKGFDMKQWLPDGDYVVISKKLYNRFSPLLWAWREEPVLGQDSGWRMVSREDNQETLDNEEAYYVSYTQLLAIEPAVSQIFGYPVGADFQMVTDQGDKYFVYNDTFEEVVPISSDKKLPLEDQAFKNHFRNFLSDPQTLVRISQPDLAELHQEVKTWRSFFSRLLSDRQQSPDYHELYILTGIGLGAFFSKRKSSRKTSRLLSTYQGFLHDDFDLSMDQASHFIRQFRVNPRPPEAQILEYGRKIRSWFIQGDFDRGQEEYKGLKDHYLNR